MRRLTRRQRVGAAVLALLALSFITLDLGGGGLRSAHSGVRGTLGALYRGTDGALGPVRRFVQGVPSAASNRATISDLRHEIAQLQGKLAAQSMAAGTAAQLQRLQLAADSGGFQMLPARVLALGAGQGFDWTVTLDVGTSSGVRVGQTVTDGVGLVGRVLHADAGTAVVLLGADPGSGVGARDLRTGQVGIATGLGVDGFRFVPLDPHATINVGDALATGPAGSSSFISGLALGTVTSVRTSADGSISADARAASAPTQLDLVGVILVGGTVEQRSPLEPNTSATSVAQGGQR